MPSPKRNGGSMAEWRGKMTAHAEDQSRRLDEVRGAIDSLGDRFEKALKDHATEDKETFAEHADRISSLRAAHSKLVGKMAVYSVVIGAAVAVAVEVLAKNFLR